MTRHRYTSKFYLKIFWIIFSIPFLVVFILFLLIANDKLGDPKLPEFEQLENPNSMLVSEVYSEDEVLLGGYYFQNRTAIKFKDLSPNLVNALLATEDIRFRKHSGVDSRGLGRVLFKTILLGQRGAGGGSTITQQLAKNLYGRDTTFYKSSFRRKIRLGVTKLKEWVTAVRLEKNYTKDEILVMYLNTVFYGSNSYGIKSAAKTFFNTTPDQLKIEEAALLVGVVNAPTKFSPIRNPERALFRRNTVLSQMFKYEFLNQEQFDSLFKIPINLNYKVEDHNQGLGTYFRTYLRKVLTSRKPERKSYYSYTKFKEDSVDWVNNPLFGWCNKNFKPDESPYNLYKDGLKIYTTINSKMQEYAEEAVRKHLGGTLQDAFDEEMQTYKSPPYSDDMTPELIDNIIERSIRRTERFRLLRVSKTPEDSIHKIFNTPTKMTVFSWKGDIDTVLTPLDSILYYKKFLRSGFLSMVPQTGEVRAYVGGPDFRYFKFDAVTLGKRQVGSTVKPFLYTLAMQEGYSPCSMVANVPTTFYLNDTTWTCKNSGKFDYEGKMVTLKWGLANSVNYISAYLMKEYNPPAVIDIAKKMGVNSYIDPVPSMFLGTSDIYVHEMVSAFSTFANKGVYVKPMYVTRIEDKNGNVISTFKPQKVEAISENTAYLMTRLLGEVVKQGTAARLRARYELLGEIGGKTGTTQNQSDGWFIGISPRLVSGAWTGWEERSIHFAGLRLGSGSNMALPIWGEYMKSIYEDESLGYSQDEIFEKPLKFNVQIECPDVEEKNDDPYNEFN